jgi:hypothetical protein
VKICSFKHKNTCLWNWHESCLEVACVKGKPCVLSQWFLCYILSLWTLKIHSMLIWAHFSLRHTQTTLREKSTWLFDGAFKVKLYFWKIF